MKLIEKVNKLEVKRTFVIAQLVRKQKFKKTFLGSLSLKYRARFLKDISLNDYEEKLAFAKSTVLSMSEDELDRLIKNEYLKRLKAINNSDWYIGEVYPEEVGVWRRAGNLPLEWTNGSLKETAKKVEWAIANNSKYLIKRAKHVVVNILKINVNKIQKEKYLLPIIFQGGTGTKGRRRLKRKMNGDIDDGCMRSIALTINGAKTIKAYIGMEKPNQN